MKMKLGFTIMILKTKLSQNDGYPKVERVSSKQKQTSQEKGL